MKATILTSTLAIASLISAGAAWAQSQGPAIRVTNNGTPVIYDHASTFEEGLLRGEADLVLEPWEERIALLATEHGRLEKRVIRTWGRRRLRHACLGRGFCLVARAARLCQALCVGRREGQRLGLGEDELGEARWQLLDARDDLSPHRRQQDGHQEHGPGDRRGQEASPEESIVRSEEGRGRERRGGGRHRRDP